MTKLFRDSANRKCIANAFVCDSKDDYGDTSGDKYGGKCVDALWRDETIS